MKASEVLRRYAAGERDFRRINLRGQSFKGQDLSGANFSEVDIRGANFTDTTLREVSFIEAKVGVMRCWTVGQLVFSFALLVILSFASAVLNTILVTYFFQANMLGEIGYIPGLLMLVMVVTVFFAIARQGFTARAFTVISGTFAVSCAFAFVSGLALTGGAYFPGVITLAGPVSGTFAGTFAIALIVTIVVTGTVIDTAVIPVIVSGVITSNFADANGDVIAIVTIFFSIYIAWRETKGDEGFVLIRTISVIFGAIGGTSFCGADLTHANFSKAILKSANFNHTGQKKTTLNQVCWEGAKRLGRARLGNTYLANPKIQQLVVTLNGQDQNYDGLNLEGVNLQGANLQDASFVGATLNYANLQDANLSRAILKQTQLDGTDLTEVTLTGAYIEDWGITGTTKLNGVQCDYIFMRVPTKENPVPLRKPDNQREMFAEGEFADFIQPYVDTLDLYHSQDVDPRAISIAFKKLSQNHPDADLEIVAMEKRGQNSLNLKVRTAPTADKSELSAEYFTDYNQLKALSEARLLLLMEKDDRIRSLEQMIQTALHQPTFNVETVQGDFMPENSGININAGESIGDISGLVSGGVSGVVNLGTISGNVTNSINQLPESSDSDQPNLKQLLMQLKEAIETDADLPDTDKVDLLEQVQNLAEAKQTEEPAQKEGVARKAKKMFEATLKSLPDTAKIVEACSKLLPLILKALGLPA